MFIFLKTGQFPYSRMKKKIVQQHVAIYSKKEQAFSIFILRWTFFCGFSSFLHLSVIAYTNIMTEFENRVE